ncbi:MAG: TRAP transporter small permease [Actinomycetia bacterium]|nr:TRAP transporter small permease [Actinomycetes bacterium]
MSSTGKPGEDREAGGTARGRAPYPPGRHIGALLERLARGVAITGGVLLVGVVLMTVTSVLGRYLFNAPIPGDYELTELACGIAVFAFFPYCHARSGNIVVEFFTGRLPPRHKTALGTLHSIAFTLVASLITWRLFVGGVHKLEDGETTLFLGIPIHWAYFSALLGAGLLTAICVLVVYRHVRALKR